MLMKKANANWRVYMDYSDLNKACPKDSFPLSRIDQLVNSTTGHELLTFMDAYSSYNQIAMHPPDKQKMTFVTNKGLYCYQVMSFSLKNAGTTYQRLVNQMFAQQIGQTMEVYVDDMLVKSIRSCIRTPRDLLNPVAVSATDKCLPTVKAEWTLDCEQAFQRLKQYLGSSPLLSKLEEGEPLLIYLVVFALDIILALIREAGGKQHPIYYTSKALVLTETRYSSMEKLALRLVLSTRRLLPYFQAHSIIVITDSLL
ncbi:uncharacterized protein LOC131238952 [Magnolia sinica]|uniref:uncharacterized protein LOC131238952 n=1 Tax=Magnolia sinica TaxID=86752 RepID=UPI002659DF3B|nr:uncharacterized protein LOC131238952 [Magnolia sinica]